MLQKSCLYKEPRIQDTSEQVQKQIEQQILDDLRRGNQKLSFPTDELILETGEDSVQAIGIKNTRDVPLDLKLVFKVKSNAAGGFNEFTSEKPEPFTTIGGINTEATIIWNEKPQTFPPGDSRVFPITITAPDKSGTYLFQVEVVQITADGSESVFDGRDFFIKTS